MVILTWHRRHLVPGHIGPPRLTFTNMSYAEITNIFGVAPSNILSRPRGQESSQQGQGPESLIKERPPKLSFPAETIIMDMQNEDGPDLFKTQTSSATVM